MFYEPSQKLFLHLHRFNKQSGVSSVKVKKKKICAESFSRFLIKT